MSVLDSEVAVHIICTFFKKYYVFFLLLQVKNQNVWSNRVVFDLNDQWQSKFLMLYILGFFFISFLIGQLCLESWMVSKEGFTQMVKILKNFYAN